MSETTTIVETLKQLLRARKITYARVAQLLNVSEASIKRCFAQKRFTLERLEEICGIAGVRVSELAQMSEKQTHAITELTAEQEQMLASDPKLLLVATLTLNNWTAEELVAQYEITENEVLGKLLKLDKLGMVELLPGNRIKRLVARNFSWRAGGPVQTYFEQQIKADFTESDFSGPGERMRFLGGMLSRENILRMHEEIDRLARRMDELMAEDYDLPMEHKLGVGAILALRPWEVPAFRAMRKIPNQKSF